MSLPSISTVAQEMGIDLTATNREQREQILVGAMKRDLGPALDLLHRKSHEAQENGVRAIWEEDPKSDLGKMLIRVHAGDVLRRLASEYFCHGLQLTFYNCCKGEVGKPSEEPEQEQIIAQGPGRLYGDC